MDKLRTSAVIACLLSLATAASVRAGDQCYERSDLNFFHQVVEIVEHGVDEERGCWIVRLRLRGQTSPQGHAMICSGNACDPRLPLRDGIYWWEAAEANENIARVFSKQNGSCTDVTFCVQPQEQSKNILITFAALFQESYFLIHTWQPRWSSGAIELTSIYPKSHCQDGEPRGAICLEH